MLFKRLCLYGVFCVASWLMPSVGFAQSTIAGVVTDDSGGVLPGVTVEVASPALIEKVRTVVSDGQGRYSVTDVRPGQYSVTFTLQGFTTVKREGVAVVSGATVPINGELRVGTINETVTVTGASPVVDVQTTARRQVVDRAALDALAQHRQCRKHLGSGARRTARCGPRHRLVAHRPGVRTRPAVS